MHSYANRNMKPGLVRQKLYIEPHNSQSVKKRKLPHMKQYGSIEDTKIFSAPYTMKKMCDSHTGIF